MDATELIEESGRWAQHVRQRPGNGTAAEDAYLAGLLDKLAAALKASEESLQDACAELAPRIACIGRMEEERRALQSANLAANKRIVELEHERDAAKRQISALENQLVNAAALRIEDEAHCERLIAERDAARAELAHPYICPNCTAKLRRLDRMDAAGHAAYELDKARKDAAGQNKRAQKAEQEAKELRAELARLTTPRPITEATKDKPVLGIWIDHRGNKCIEVLRWDGRWRGALGTPLYREAEYLPLPEVKP